MHFFFTINITRTFIGANKRVVTDKLTTGPRLVEENDQRTTHEYFSDAVKKMLTDYHVERNTEGLFLFDNESCFQSIKARVTTIGNFVRSNRLSLIVDDVGNYAFFMNAAAQLKDGSIANVLLNLYILYTCTEY